MFTHEFIVSSLIIGIPVVLLILALVVIRRDAVKYRNGIRLQMAAIQFRKNIENSMFDMLEKL